MDGETPGLFTAVVAVARRDLLLAWKRPGDVLNPLFFFAMVATLFPLAVGPSNEQLEFSGPGVLWAAALLAMLLSLNSLFVSDFEDGSLDQMLVSPQPLPALALGKTLAHWMTSGLPLVLVSPVVALTFRMPVAVVGVLMLTLLLGTISLSLLGAIGAALTVGLEAVLSLTVARTAVAGEVVAVITLLMAVPASISALGTPEGRGEFLAHAVPCEVGCDNRHVNRT